MQLLKVEQLVHMYAYLLHFDTLDECKMRCLLSLQSHALFMKCSVAHHIWSMPAMKDWDPQIYGNNETSFRIAIYQIQHANCVTNIRGKGKNFRRFQSLARQGLIKKMYKRLISATESHIIRLQLFWLLKVNSSTTGNLVRKSSRPILWISMS